MKTLDFSKTKAWITCGTNRLLAPLPLPRAVKPFPIDEVLVDLDRPRQTIEGFGGAITESSAATLAEMPAPVQKKVLQALFDPKKGNGFTLCRTHINSCDFALDFHACADKPGDTSLSSFNLDREKKWVLPFIRQASKIAGRPIQLLGSPWSPPAWMKTTSRMEQGGKLIPKYRKAWADYYVRFIREMQKEGVSMWGITVQNEPQATQTWESCIYTAEEERDFVRDYLGPALAKAGLSKVRLLIWDHNRDWLYHRAKVVYDDPKAAQYVWGAAFHWYDGSHFQNVGLLHEAYPDKRLLFTEGCIGGWLESKPEYWGESYGRSMISDLNGWTDGWIDWNLILNDNCGPSHARKEGKGGCQAPVMYDRATRKASLGSGYYYMGHFSRFIRPGARGLVTAKTSDRLETTAAINPDGSVATVVLNRSEREVPFYITDMKSRLPLVSPPHSIITVIIPSGQVASKKKK